MYMYIYEIREHRVDELLVDSGLGNYVGMIDIGYGLHYSTHPYIYDYDTRFSTSTVGARTKGYAFETSGVLTTDTWHFFEDYVVPDEGGSYGNPRETLIIWSNTNILNPDGSIYLSASDSFPVIE